MSWPRNGEATRVGVLTVSDSLAGGGGTDWSGACIVAWCTERSFSVARRAVVADGTSNVAPVLLGWADGGDIDLILTTGGTGFTPRDLTPEAARAASGWLATGLADFLRMVGEASTPFSVLSRGEIGLRGECLIVNFPGSPGGVRDGLAALGSFLAPGTSLLRGRRDPHPPHPGRPGEQTADPGPGDQ